MHPARIVRNVRDLSITEISYPATRFAKSWDLPPSRGPELIVSGTPFFSDFDGGGVEEGATRLGIVGGGAHTRSSGHIYLFAERRHG
jgi:hypothetical protein